MNGRRAVPGQYRTDCTKCHVQDGIQLSPFCYYDTEKKQLEKRILGKGRYSHTNGRTSSFSWGALLIFLTFLQHRQNKL